MKTLLILRHGKAELDNMGGDRKRELTERGRDDARAIGRELKKRGFMPDLVVCSDATRAKQTALLVSMEAGYKGENYIQPLIYDGGVEGVLFVLRGLSEHLSEEVDSVLLIGHNPTLEILAAELIDPNTIQTREITLPTCGLVALEFDTEKWSGVRGSLGTLLWAVTPKSLELG